MPNLTAELHYQGARGYSAYEIAVQHGYTGTEEQWIEDQGRGVSYVTKSGTGQAGTYDTYTFHFVNGETYSFDVYNGGDGSGDMLRSVYDTNGNGVVDNAEKVNGHTVLSDVPANPSYITDDEKTYIDTTVPATLTDHDTRITSIVNSLGTQVTYTLDGTTLIITTK